MASIRKIITGKGEGYKIDYYDSDGKRHVKSLYCDRKTAEALAKQIEYKKSRILLGLDNGSDKKITLERAFLHYLRVMETQKEASTIKREKKVYKPFVNYIGNLTVRSIGLKDMEGYINKRYKTDGLTPATIGIEIRTLRAFFNFMIKHGYLENNPTKGLNGPKQKEHSIRFLTIDEINRLLDVTDDPNYRDLILMYLHTGARREEILPVRFTWDNVDLQRRRIKLIGKRNKIRFIPINDTVYEILDRRKFAEKHEQPFDFNYEYLFKKIHKYYVAAGIENANIHTFRKTYGSLLVQSGVDIFTVSKLLGHSSVKVTEKHYADLLEDNLLSGVKALDGLIKYR
ncbi:MAG: tyrosine-type recombinase/integrase [Candidatus Marinimicrobia bacterium]|nr:tyrosine-type recombinase/integrase [Candidatus Neomarinimicrobiota bacterium]